MVGWLFAAFVICSETVSLAHGERSRGCKADMLFVVDARDCRHCRIDRKELAKVIGARSGGWWVSAGCRDGKQVCFFVVRGNGSSFDVLASCK